MKIPELKIGKIKFLVVLTALLITTLLYMVFVFANQFDESILETIKFTLCWTGIAELLFITITWGKTHKGIVSLYTLFMLFFFLFNFGQCFLWAFGVHIDGEIGSVGLYYKLDIPTNLDIVKAQTLVLISGLMIHTGAIIVDVKQDKRKNKSAKTEEAAASNDKLLFSFCKILYPIVVFSEFYYLIVNVINSRQFGYTALYYNHDIENVSVIFMILSRLFFPVLVGLLFSSNYNKTVTKIVYGTFFIDIMLSVAAGDRGGWLYSLAIIIICHHLFHKKIRTNQYIKLGILGYLGMALLVAVRNIRNHGVTISGITTALSASNNSPIIDTLMEMGGTMGITTALMMKGWDIFPYGNTFLYGILIAPTKRVITWLNLNYESISGWFSQSYLGISNGAGFSIVGETIINFGPYLLPLFMIVFGIIIHKITYVENLDFEKNKMRILYKVITTSVVVSISRNSFNYTAGEILYTTLLFYILFSLFKSSTRIKRGKHEKQECTA